MHYIFGYGSLICADSRSRTGVSGTAEPIEVMGISRRWSAHTPEWPATAVGAHIEATSTCNGVYFEVDEENLSRFDNRERGYSRIQLEWKNVSALSATKLPSTGTLWAYVTNIAGEPNQHKPIMQSYLDVILNGCLDYSVDFAEKFTLQTSLWQHLVDDRTAPLYPRPLKSNKRQSQIDEILNLNLPGLMQSRKIHQSD